MGYRILLACLLVVVSAPVWAARQPPPAAVPPEEDAVEEDTYVGRDLRELSRRKPLVDAPAKKGRAREVPGPALPVSDLDPAAVPPPPATARARLLALPRDPAAKERVLTPPPLSRERYVNPLVKRIFPGQERAEYTGDGTCLNCHKTKKDDWRRSVYGLVHYDRGTEPDRRGCEGCHGPGSVHIEQGGDKEWITNPERLDRRKISKLCLSCHAEERLIRRQAWHFTDHNESDVTCLDCHSIHKPKADKALADEPNRLCLKCHADQKAFFTMTSRHPVKVEQVHGLQSLREGKVRCIDCHQAYSARNPRNLRGDKSEACLSCHPEFRGPFVFQHGGGNEVLSDGCMTCHLGHGSPNRALVKRPDRALCLTCHTDRFDHFQGPSCFTTGGCHSDIHGSNTNRLMLGGLGNLNNLVAPLGSDSLGTADPEPAR